MRGVFNFIRLARLVPVIVSILLLPSIAWGWSWTDLWKTPHQQQRALEQAGDYQSLMQSDSEQWRGVGHYRSGDYAAAADSFSAAASESESAVSAGSAAPAVDINASYNAATALTRTGNYDSAIEQFEQILQQNPEHQKAAHNLEIARQLKQLQQQNSQQNQDSDQQQGENSEQQQDQNQQQSEQQQSESKQQQSEQNQSSSEQQDSDSQTAEEQQAQKQEQREQEQQDEATEQQAEQASAMQSEEPLTEDQQAIEQWLRKIPDDPSGLLRRKLRRSHATDYPGVRDSQSPW